LRFSLRDCCNQTTVNCRASNSSTRLESTKKHKGDCMKRPTKTRPAPQTTKGQTLQLQAEPGKGDDVHLAECVTQGIVPVASVLTTYSRDTSKDDVSLTEAYRELLRLSNASVAGNLAHAERLLSAQAMALNAIFAGLAHRAKENSQAGYLDASETYLKLALRAQGQCRATVETLFEMKNPRAVAFVKQANIAGAQMVNNGPFATNTRTGARAGETQSAPNEQSRTSHELLEDIGASQTAGGAHSPLEAVGAVNRSTHT
jgi:hypothetical protein